MSSIIKIFFILYTWNERGYTKEPDGLI